VIDRKTALLCATMIALMLVAAVWRIVTLEDWTTLAVQHGAPLTSLRMFIFPACSALVVGALYWSGPKAGADAAKIQPWRRWGAPLSLGYCGGMLLLQCVLIVESLGLDMPLRLSAVSRALGLVMAILSLLAINRMPKLPYFEQTFAPGGELGPIYGPRYVRTVSRILVVFMIAVIAYSLAAPGTGWRSALFIVLAAAVLVVWSVAWRYHLARKWSFEQMAQRGAKA
jgi:hypothetical protein